MTVFDVIRYPISMPPTMEELAACPKDVFHEWQAEHFGMVGFGIATATLHNMWYGSAFRIADIELAEYIVCNLRRMIAEYEE